MLTSRWKKRGLNKNKKMKTFAQFMEAVGDPIKSSQVIPMDAETQRNLRNAMTPTAAPKPAPKRDKVTDFLQRMRINTMLSPL